MPQHEQIQPAVLKEWQLEYFGFAEVLPSHPWAWSPHPPLCQYNTLCKKAETRNKAPTPVKTDTTYKVLLFLFMWGSPAESPPSTKQAAGAQSQGEKSSEAAAAAVRMCQRCQGTPPAKRYFSSHLQQAGYCQLPQPATQPQSGLNSVTHPIGRQHAPKIKGFLLYQGNGLWQQLPDVALTWGREEGTQHHRWKQWQPRRIREVTPDVTASHL